MHYGIRVRCPRQLFVSSSSVLRQFFLSASSFVCQLFVSCAPASCTHLSRLSVSWAHVSCSSVSFTSIARQSVVRQPDKMVHNLAWRDGRGVGWSEGNTSYRGSSVLPVGIASLRLTIWIFYGQIHKTSALIIIDQLHKCLQVLQQIVLHYTRCKRAHPCKNFGVKAYRLVKC